MMYFLKVEVSDKVITKIDRSSKVRDANEYILELIRGSIESDLGKHEVTVHFDGERLLLKNKIHRRNIQIEDLKKENKKLFELVAEYSQRKGQSGGYPAETLVRGLAGYLKWCVGENITSESTLSNIVHDIFGWLKDKNENWFSPRTKDYEKYIR